MCTYLYQLAAVMMLAMPLRMRGCISYLGENVVSEKEYRSAMVGLCCR